MDKRRDNRIQKKMPVRFYYEGNAFLSYTGDLSRRGICIQTLRPCPVGKGINIEIEARNEKISLAGYIVWSRGDMERPSMIFPGGMGVQLLNYQKEGYQSLVKESY